ncbi:aminotransferase [Bifidobacterium boum]|uniref:Aminotransferase n=2 Tax=Bifidobacterium boum TaxID=78343 RepID=A0A086ZFJ0_9BIFI|nr:aminotransferase [Bifidobacterium boum]
MARPGFIRAGHTHSGVCNQRAIRSSNVAAADYDGGMRFSSRVDISDPNAIAQAEQAAKAGGIALDKLNDSNPTRFALAPRSLPTVYAAQPRGPLAARRVLARFLTDRHAQEAVQSGAPNTVDPVDPEHLYLLSSTSQAYSWLMKLLCDAGDVILAPKPGYPLIESIAALECVEVMTYQQRFDGSWIIDTAQLQSALESPQGERIRALVLINPNNPTGSYVKPEERESIVRLCADHGIAIIADEVFYDFPVEPFPGNARLAGERRVLTFALDGLSKMLAAPHAKVGWIQVSGPQNEVSQALHRLDVIADDYLPMSDIIAARLPDMLEEAKQQTVRVRDRVTGNAWTLRRMLQEDPRGLVSMLRMEGGWNALVRIPSVLDENEMVLRMIRDHKLTGQPGYFFDMTANGYLAVSLLPQPDQFARNIAAVLDTVAVMIGE